MGLEMNDFELHKSKRKNLARKKHLEVNLNEMCHDLGYENHNDFLNKNGWKEKINSIDFERVRKTVVYGDE